MTLHAMKLPDDGALSTSTAGVILYAVAAAHFASLFGSFPLAVGTYLRNAVVVTRASAPTYRQVHFQHIKEAAKMPTKFLTAYRALNPWGWRYYEQGRDVECVEVNCDYPIPRSFKNKRKTFVDAVHRWGTENRIATSYKGWYRWLLQFVIWRDDRPSKAFTARMKEMAYSAWQVLVPQDKDPRRAVRRAGRRGL